MNCAYCEERLSDYIEGALDASEAKRILSLMAEFVITRPM